VADMRLILLASDAPTDAMTEAAVASYGTANAEDGLRPFLADVLRAALAAAPALDRERLARALHAVWREQQGGLDPKWEHACESDKFNALRDADALLAALAREADQT